MYAKPGALYGCVACSSAVDGVGQVEIPHQPGRVDLAKDRLKRLKGLK